MTVSFLRWHVKKISRRAIARAGSVAGTLRLISRYKAERCIRVLTYHRLGEIVRDPWAVSRRDFEAHMRWLANRRLAVSLAELEMFVIGNSTIQEGSVLVTIDDGFRCTFTEMLPILMDYAIPAVAFVTPGLIRNAALHGNTSGEYMSWSELEQVVASGMSVGTHGWTHRSLARMPAAEARDEMLRSREVLETRLGRSVTAIAYPFGTRRDFNSKIVALAAETGHSLGFTSQHGSVTGGAARLMLPRIKVEGGEKSWMFPLLCRGGMDVWRLVDQILWYIQTPSG